MGMQCRIWCFGLCHITTRHDDSNAAGGVDIAWLLRQFALCCNELGSLLLFGFSSLDWIGLDA